VRPAALALSALAMVLLIGFGAAPALSFPGSPGHRIVPIAASTLGIQSLAVAPNGTAYAVDGEGYLDKIVAGAVTLRAGTGSSPSNDVVAVSADGSTVYVGTQNDGIILTFNAITLAAGAPIAAGDTSINDLAVSGGTLYAVDGAGYVDKIVGGVRTARTGIGESPSRDRITVSADGSTVYVGTQNDGDILTFDAATLAAGTPIAAGDTSIFDLTVSGAALYATDGAGYVDKMVGGVRTARVGIGESPWGDVIAVSADGNTVFVGTRNDGDVLPFNAATLVAGTPIATGAGGAPATIRALATAPNGVCYAGAGDGYVYEIINTHTLTADAGANGSIAPDSQTVDEGSDSTSFTITPSGGYYIAGVTVDGDPVARVSSYKFHSVTLNHTLGATFAPKMTVTVAATAADKVYDGNSDASVEITTSDFVGGDDVHLAYTSASFSNRNVGTGKTVTVSGISLTGADADKYTLASATAATTASITKRDLHIDAVADTKVYDGGTSSAGGPTVSGLADADTVTGKVQTFDTKDIGSGKTLSVTDYTVNDGNSGRNYRVFTDDIHTGVITAKNLTISGAVADSKTYDGNTTATVSFGSASLVGVVAPDVVTIDSSAYLAHFGTKGVGTGKAVTVTGVALGGADAGNYTVSQPSELTANITAKGLTISGAVAGSKTYNGETTTTVDFGDAGLVGVVSPDVVTIDSSGYHAHFDTKVIGTGKPVTVTGVTLGGADAGNYTVSQPSGLTANITARNITISGAVAGNKVYDGNATATVSFAGASLVGTITGDVVTIDSSAYSATFNNRNVGTGKAVAVTGVALSGADAGNYTVSQPSGLTANITAKALTITAVTDTKVYDGNVSSAATPTVSGLVDGDTVTGLVQAFETRIAGTGKTILVTSFALSDGNFGNNYAVSAEPVATGVITRAPLSITAVTDTKVYDGNASSVGTPTVSGLVDADTVTGLVQAFSNKSAATGKTLSVTAYTVNDGNTGGNYTVTTHTDTTGVITAKGITISGAAANNKVYDGNATATVSFAGASLVGTVTGDVVTIDSSACLAHFNNRNVGTGKAVTVTGVALGGADAGNYTLSQPSGLTANITAKALSITAVTDTKLYDGNASSTGVPTVSGLVDADTVTGLAQAFNSPDVATGKTLNVSHWTVNDGNSGLNYAVTPYAVNDGVITAKDLYITAVTDTKVYDGTTSSDGVPTVLGLVGSDSVNATQTFDTKNVSIDTTLSVTAYTVNDGNHGDNYRVFTDDIHTGVITAKGLTISGAVADSKTYDGNATATVSFGSASLVGVVSPDVVTIDSSAYLAHFNNRNVGSGKAVTVTGVALGGADAGNYTLSQPSGLTANITAKALSITAISDTKLYDGNTSSANSPSVSGLVGGDSVAATQTFDTKNAGTGKTLTVTAYTVSDGNGGANYTVTTHTDTTGVITRAPLSITAVADTKVYDGGTSSVGTPTVSGLVDADTVTGLVQAFDTRNAGTGKTLSVTTYTVNDGNSGGNYTVTTHDVATGVITAKDLYINAATDTKLYDGNTSSDSTPTVSGLVDADTVTGLLQTFDTKAAGTGKTLTVVDYTVNDGNGGNNYHAFTDDIHTGVITRVGLTISGAVANNKVYDGNATATVSFGSASLVGTLTGDVVTIDSSAYSATFNNRNVGTGKAVTVTGVTLGGTDAGNYTLSQPSGLTANITAKALSIAAISDTKTYDGNTSSANSPSVSGLVGSDSVAATQTFDTKNAGTGKTLSVTAYVVNDGNGGANYTVTTPSVTTGVISRAPLSITAVTGTKVYDGNTSSVGTPTVSGLVDADTVTGLAQAFSNKSAATGKTLSVTAYTVNDGNTGGNYTVTTHDVTTGVITAKGITISGAVANNKTYDGNATATVSFGSASLVGTITGDVVTINSSACSATFNNRNVGTGKAVTVTGVTLGGTDAGNYTLSQPSGLTANITAKALSITAATDTKVYDGNASSAGVPTVSGLVGGDTVTGLVQTFDNHNAGTGKTLSVTAYTVVDGNSGANYAVTTHTDTTGVISAKSVTGHFTADGKTYDGGVGATVLTRSLTGVVGSDDVSLSGGTASFSSADVGDGKTVTLTGASLSGANAGNYTLGAVNTTTAGITAKGLTISGAVANSKTYDGNATATVSFASASLVGTVTGDVVTIDSSAYSAVFADPATGHWTVTVTGVALSGTDAGNYTLAQPTGLAADINPADPTAVRFGIISTTRTRVVWTGSAGATGYRVYLGGVLQGTVGSTATSFTILSFRGPSADIEVQAIGGADTHSTAVQAIYAATTSVKMATIHFTGDSSSISTRDKATLRALAVSIAANGFHSMTVNGYAALASTASHRFAISRARANAVKAYLAGRFHLLHASVTIAAVGKGWVPLLGPALSNVNRRAEVFVR
jgi:hypothetical protein